MTEHLLDGVLRPGRHGRIKGWRQDAVVVGAVAGVQPAERSAEVGDGAAAGGEDGDRQPSEEAAASRPGKGGGECDEPREGVQE